MHKLVVQTDFGLQDGAVNAMYGVAYQVAPELVIADLTHEIEPYNIHDASYRLLQSVTYWPAGTVFVSVVDPGVGSDRRSVVAKLATGQLVLTPDNGTLTYLATYIGIAELRVINEATDAWQDQPKAIRFMVGMFICIMPLGSPAAPSALKS